MVGRAGIEPARSLAPRDFQPKKTKGLNRLIFLKYDLDGHNLGTVSGPLSRGISILRAKNSRDRPPGFGHRWAQSFRLCPFYFDLVKKWRPGDTHSPLPLPPPRQIPIALPSPPMYLKEETAST